MNETEEIKGSFDALCMSRVAIAVAAEREACAKVCENIKRNGAWITKEEASAAIRARNQA